MDATIEYTRTQTAPPLGEFDLDVRLAPGPRLPPIGFPTADTRCFVCGPLTRERTACLPFTCADTCNPRTCITRDDTCITCQTRCDTCVTQCDTCARTCDTCPTRCETRCDTCGIACTIECPTRERTCNTCGIACTRVTCQPTRCDPCITRDPACELTMAC